MSLIKIRMLFGCILFISAITFAIFAQPNPTLDKKTARIDITDQTLSDSLIILTREFRVPIGFVKSSRGDSGKLLNLHLKSATLLEALDALVNLDELYSWTFENGVVRFSSKTDSDPKLDELLALRISQFKIQSIDNRPELRAAIYELPEVVEFLGKNSLVSDRLETVIQFGTARQNLGIELEGHRLSEVLDQVITKSSMHFWILSRFGDKSEFVSLNFS